MATLLDGLQNLNIDTRTETGPPEGYQNTWYNGHDVPLANPNLSTERYLDFYDKRANVKNSHFKVACDAVDEVLNDIFTRAKRFREVHSPIIGDFLRCGSACEGTKAVRPDEFDVIVPLEINEQTHGCSYKVLTYKDDSSIPVGFAMCKLTGRPAGTLDMLCHTGNTHAGNGTFISIKKLILYWFYNLLHKAISQRGNKDSDIQVEVQQKEGPALVLIITSTSNAFAPIGTNTIKVDVVPAVKFDPLRADTRFVVATKQYSDYHYFEHKYGTDLQKKLQWDYQLYWRISMTFHERAHFAHLEDRLGPDSCHSACLKILKAKRWLARTKKSKRTICWKYVSSYMLKTALFWTIQRKGSREDWSFDVLPNRIQDILKKVRAGFESGSMPNFFYNNKSLAREFPDDTFFLDESDGVNLVYPGAERVRDLVAQNLAEVRDRLDAKFNAVESVDGESDISDTVYQMHLLAEGPEEDQEVNLSTDCNISCRASSRSMSRPCSLNH